MHKLIEQMSVSLLDLLNNVTVQRLMNVTLTVIYVRLNGKWARNLCQRLIYKTWTPPVFRHSGQGKRHSNILF